jgi:hypothetical protein
MHRTPVWCYAFLGWLATSSLAESASASYYTAIDVNRLTPDQYNSLYPTTPLIPLTDAQIRDLPGVYGYQGVIWRQYRFFPMQNATYSNAEGTVLGIVPNGDSYGEPYSTPTIGYARMQPDGHFGPFVPLSSEYTAVAWINSQNQILLGGSLVNPKEIIDLNKGTTTDFASLVSPETLAAYGGWLYPDGIADNGAIHAEYYKNGTFGNVILMPPSPSPVPEPTALAVLALGLGGIVLRRCSARKAREKTVGLS